ncbi:hypothetical protein DPX16_16895 [Anabarilius grahami]|uniref:Uncharacterized protein n=1 Tax=Anabarilius grahami TaxID=495550 RepID=A0A3N0YMC0_ANAGA|nr:hypothetical protein DPX16_16895 [Anabarilius grahami]
MSQLHLCVCLRAIRDLTWHSGQVVASSTLTPEPCPPGLEYRQRLGEQVGGREGMKGWLTRTYSLCHRVSGVNGDSYALRQLSNSPT